MTYKELQAAIKAYREQGYHITVRLNASKEVLEMELYRLELKVAEEAVAEEAVAEGNVTYEANENQVIFVILDDTVSDKVNVACSEETLNAASGVTKDAQSLVIKGKEIMSRTPDERLAQFMATRDAEKAEENLKEYLANSDNKEYPVSDTPSKNKVDARNCASESRNRGWWGKRNDASPDEVEQVKKDYEWRNDERGSGRDARSSTSGSSNDGYDEPWED